MVDPVSNNQTGTIETRKDLGSEPDATYAYWMGQEKIAEREERKWIKQARKIVQRYRDERPEADKQTNRFNILWSNVQTLIPTLYARTPKADVERRFRDDDPTARLASTLLERCITFSADQFDFDDMMGAVTEDRLLPGRGTARVLYVPHFGDEIKDAAAPKPDAGGNAEFANANSSPSIVDNPGDESDDEAGEKKGAKDEAEPLREVTYEEAKPAYVFWEDYREGPARKWQEVPWIRYRSYLTRDDLVNRFGKKKGNAVNLDFTPKGSGSEEKENPPPDMFKKAVVHEYWDKTKSQAIWLAPGTPDLILDKQDDPLKLPGFFPSPNPCLATTTNDKRIPVPDFIEYQDQARELDKLTARIDVLTQALAVKGIYPGENKQVLQQLFDSGDNQLIPVQDFAAFANSGSLKDMVQWLPIQQVAETLIQLYNARDRVKNILYEITGIGDIMRGMTSPDETLGAQELKANFSTRRITPQQKSIARFARDMFRLIGGVIAEHFSAKTISEVTGYPQLAPVPQLPPQPQMPPQPLQLAPPQALQPQGMPQNGGQPGMPAAAPQPAPPSPQMQAYEQQMAQWQQVAQQVQALTQANQQKQQQFDAAVALIKQDGVHGFRIDIEADSTIAPDEQAEKKARTEFMQQFVPFMETVIPIAQGNPAMADMAKEMTLFVVRGYRVARPLEETIEKAFAAIAQMPPNPKATGQDGKAPAGKQGADPAEIAAKVHETETRAATETQTAAVDAAAQTQKSSDAVTIAREKNATLLMIQNQKTQQVADQAAQEAPHREAEIALEGQRVANERDIAMTREQNVASRGARELQ
jgi:hypothetical protein